jgi:hypothetical protein
MGHLDSRRSLPTIGGDKNGFSPTAKKLRLAPGQQVAVLNAPAGYLTQLETGPADIATELRLSHAYNVVHLFANSPEELRRLGQITSVTGHKPVAFVAVNDNYTALRFKRA